MLVLSRRTEEEIVIDGQIRIKVLSTSRGKVRLGISAPDDVHIERSELSPRTIECLAPLRSKEARVECDVRRPTDPGSQAAEASMQDLGV